MIVIGLLPAHSTALRFHIHPFPAQRGTANLEECARAARELDLICYPPNGLWSQAQFIEELQNERTTAIGAWAEGETIENSAQLVGMAFTTTVLDETALTSIAVHPFSRRRGVAEALLKECMSRAQIAGATRFTLEVRAGNAAAQRLYAKLGMACVGRRRRYYPDGEDAAIFDGGVIPP